MVRKISKKMCAAMVLLTLICSFQTAYPSDLVANRPKGVDAEAGDPISMSTGSYSFDIPLLNLRGTLPLNAKLSYYTTESALESDPLNYKGVYFSFNHRLSKWGSGGTPIVEIYLGYMGETPRFSKISGKWINASYSNPSRQYDLQETSGYYYLMDGDDYVVFVFEKINLSQDPADGRIKWITDRNGNRLSYTYASADSVIPESIFENEGGADARKFQVKTQSIGGKTMPVSLTERIYNGGTEQDGRSVGLEFDDKGFLLSVTDAEGKKTGVSWSSYDGSITGITHPEGNTPYTQTYKRTEPTAGSSTKSVVTSQTDAYGNKTTFDYAKGAGFDPLATATETRPDGTAVKYRHTAEYRPPTSITDASGKTVNFKISSFNNSISSVTDRLGGVTSFTYDTTGYRKLLSITNAAGNKMSFTYTAQDTVFTNPANKETVTFTFRNLSKVAYPDNTVEEIAYDDKGNVSVYTDRAGKKWQYEYNGRGQAVKITNPSGGVITYDYNADGTLKSSKDSDTGTTAYAYDSSRRPVKVTRPDGKTVQVEYDKNDRIISLTDEKGHKYIYAYDDNGNLTEIKDPAGSSLKYVYDLMDRVEKITDRLGNTRVLSYNNMGRLASVIDPTSVKTEFGYDPRGWVNEIKQAGKTWKIAHDDESVVASVTTPAGNTTSYQTDALGHVTKVTDSSDAETNLVLDTMSRVTEISDALNRKTGYAYDPEGRLSGITLPAVGKAVYERNDLGIVRQITDLKGSPWKFDYSEAGRISSMSDPLGNQWNYTRDTRGRVSQIAYPDGVTQTISYDDTGNIAGQSYSKGPDMKFDYDALDRLLSADSISLVRDAEGNITDTRQGDIGFGAVYDAAGRLKTVTYNNGALTVEYVYNAENGLLTGVKDTLTQKEVTFAYDDDRQLVGINRSNGINTTYDYDETGKLIRILDGSIIDLKYSFDKAGQIIGADITVPLSPEALLVKQSSEFDYNEASQVSSDKYAYDKRGRLTASPDRQYSWDGASRLIKIGDVNLTYNGMDDVLTRNDGTSSIRYFYNYAVGLNPVMAEKNETGSFLRYYVWTPGGQLLYMIDAENGNKAYYYHFDHAGSTLALSDAAGTVTDKYAYLPYVELLKHEGSNPQPFTFIGKFGVRLESASLYQMRARYYDAKSGRFLSTDPVWPRISEPREINPYIYAAANPMGWIDPTGLAGYKLGGGFWDPDFMGNRETTPKESEYERVFVYKERPDLKESDGFIPIVETEEWRKIPSFRVVQDFDTNIIYNKTPGEIKIMLDDNIAEELYTGGENLSQFEVREVNPNEENLSQFEVREVYDE